jgi:hypothetical protein
MEGKFTNADPMKFKLLAAPITFEAICTANLENAAEPQTSEAKRKTAEDTAIAKWAERWHQAPRTSLAYRTALTAPRR